jgi:UDP-N-acetylglucosamine--dolichyl-phosphate N-acetylglucosaminephosphotransferase
VCASIYILSLILFIPFAFSRPIHEQATFKESHEGITVVEFPHHQVSISSFKLQNSSSWLNLPQKLAVYLSSLLSLLMATLLGFLDDVFDIRWRHKLPIPIIASIPLLMVYSSERGNTNVVVPLPLRFIFGTLINLGKLSYSHNL